MSSTPSISNSSDLLAIQASFCLDPGLAMSTIIEELEQSLGTTEASPIAKSIFTIGFIISELIGIPLILGIVFFEKYGHDPLKRSLYNQLLSAAWICVMVYFPLNHTIILIRMFYGILPSAIGYLATFLTILGTVFFLLSIMEAVVYRMLQRVKFHAIAMGDDDFLHVFLTMANLMLGMLVAGTAIILDDKYPILIHISSTEKVTALSSIFDFVFGLVACVVVVLIITNFVIWKYKTQEDPAPVPAAPNLAFNNQSHNPIIINFKGLAAIVCIICYLAISNYVIFIYKDFTDGFLYGKLQSQFAAMIVFPTFFSMINLKGSLSKHFGNMPLSFCSNTIQI